MADEETTENEDNQDSGENVDSETTDTDDDTDQTSEDDDTSSSDDDEETGSSEDSDEEDEEEEAENPTIPKHRFDEEISKKKRAEERVEDLQEQLNALTQIQSSQRGDDAKSKKSDLRKKLKDLGYDNEQIEANIEIAEEFGGGADARRQIEDLRTQLAQEKDKSELDRTVQDFSSRGIDVSKDDIEAQRKEWLRDSDPRVQLQADLPYPTIVQLMKGTEINEREVNASISKKKKTSTKVDGGKKTSKRTPESTKLVFDPSDPTAFSEALERETLKRLIAEE